MKKKLRCYNEKCESNIGNRKPMFSIKIVVDEDGDPYMCDVKHLGEKFFTCCICHGYNTVEWHKETDQ